MYKLIQTNRTEDGKNFISGNIGSPIILIDIKTIGNEGEEWIRAGFLSAQYTSEMGVVQGISIPINFGLTEVKLDVPGYPYTVLFRPRSWVIKWDLRLHEKTLGGPIGVSNVPAYTENHTKQETVYVSQKSVQMVLPDRPGRHIATAFNSTSAKIYIGFDANLSQANAIETLYPDGQWESTEGYDGPVYFLSDGAPGTLKIVEYLETAI